MKQETKEILIVVIMVIIAALGDNWI